MEGNILTSPLSSRVEQNPNVYASPPIIPIMSRMKQTLRKNQDLRRSIRKQAIEKENIVNEIKEHSQETTEELRDKVILLQEKLLEKSRQVDILKLKMQYAVSDKENELSYANTLRTNIESDNETTKKRLNKSQVLIRKNRDEITTLKRELDYNEKCAQKYKQRSARLQRKLRSVLQEKQVLEVTKSKFKRELQQLEKNIHEAQIANNGGNAFYSLWHQEYHKVKELTEKVENLEVQLTDCKTELAKEKETVGTLMESNKKSTSRYEKELSRVNLRASFNTVLLMLVTSSCIQKFRILRQEKEDLESKLRASCAVQLETIYEKLLEWGSDWKAINNTVVTDIAQLKIVLARGER